MSNREDTAMDATIIPAGIESYADVLGRTQFRAVGPNGTFLITRAAHTWEVWRSDSLNTIARDRNLRPALEVAVYYANVGH
jgi:hypothetical protein